MVAYRLDAISMVQDMDGWQLFKVFRKASAVGMSFIVASVSST